MSVSTTANSPSRSGVGKLWLAILLLVAAGVALAWFGAGELRGQSTPSGLQFRIVEAGSGPYVKPVDGVLIEYEGRLPDGTVFDSTEGHGPAPMIAGQVIPGFAEALTMMQKDGRYRVRIPAALGYGASPPAGGPIPTNSDLEFDIHLVQLVPNAALMQGAAEPQGGEPQAELPQDEQPQPEQPQAQPPQPTP
ncbi:MAG: FKBP-type peptidyl-prolyl cis-trans isomerase [Sphingomicrobium sp.]